MMKPLHNFRDLGRTHGSTWHELIDLEPQAAPRTLRRVDRVLIGFWLGGFGLGTAGCIVGACMSYHHPVAVMMSVVWWGIYLGCLGASLGAGIGGLFPRNARALSQIRSAEEGHTELTSTRQRERSDSHDHASERFSRDLLDNPGRV
jgi:hypothetical protein